jgi:hypothetical protein
LPTGKKSSKINKMPLVKRILFLIFFISLLSPTSQAQNIFPVKLSNCEASRFCLDCGEIKATVDAIKLDELTTQLTSKLNLRGISGIVKFQILIDSTGKGCVLSHTDLSKSLLTDRIVTALNNFNGFISPKTNGKTEERTSFSMIFEIRNQVIIARVERVDMAAFKKGFDRPRDPEIFNKKYKYKNKNLRTYDINSWTSTNSNLPNNFNDYISIDKTGTIWLTVEEGLVTFDGFEFRKTEPKKKTDDKYVMYRAIATDHNNTKWVSASDHIYRYNDGKWTAIDTLVNELKGVIKIINNPFSSEVFFCTSKGLVILKNNKWELMSKEVFSKMPDNVVFYANRDSKNRLWIGTTKGSFVMDPNGSISLFNDSENVLNGKCITSMDEDENGNLFFGIYEYNRKIPSQVNNNEGIVLLTVDGVLTQYTSDNSGMPFNHVTQVLYDRNEKVLWIATDRAGLVRYDFKGNWENYHNRNSDIPTSYISAMALDKNGVLYLATRQGLVRVKKKLK